MLNAILPSVVGVIAVFASQVVYSSELDEVLLAENAEAGVAHSPADVVDDLTYLRRVSVDLIGRIPDRAEIDEFQAWPEEARRRQLVEKLIVSERFVDTWTVFYADLLRLRSNADGGAAAIAYVHQSIEDEVPYDELVRKLIAAGGKANAVPEVGFVLGDAADPMALASACAQVFMGIRVSCAQCHDHPFDKWTQEDFYGLAAYFGKTQRYESQFTRTVYTREVEQSMVLWPPEGMEGDEPREPMIPTFLFPLDEADGPRNHVARLNELRDAAEAAIAAREASAENDIDLDALLDDVAEKADRRASGEDNAPDQVVDEAKRDARSLNIQSGMASESELRRELAELITSPYNGYFSRNFVNRVWYELVGRGFVEPVDDFSDNNPPSHPETLGYLADEFVANGYDLRWLVSEIVSSDAYSREHDFGENQAELERAFLATPMRRMRSETIYDSIITAGHLFDVKHPAGQNMKVVWQQTQVPKDRGNSADPKPGDEEMLASRDAQAEMSKPGDAAKPRGDGYNLESAIAVDFDALLAANAEEEDAAVEVEAMEVMSNEEIEAMRMAAQMRTRREVDYVDRFVRAEIDDNPQFDSAQRMISPADPEHFVRVFGQTDRAVLGEHRDRSPTMRQALMMLNGRLTHESARVGELEPVYELLTGPSADLDAAVALAYQETLTREPTREELAEGREIVESGETPLEGMADLRWLLLNCNEFRFIR
ncbi:MAG: DUF1553 domain-containing protein [Planctomycetota bacterium]|nr:MAG: DUF1553 domain-containing protein [Planctomycetota bacterium]REK28296.1 MAG: DUF1553 domain-containing protein [Planctomycetota bacterium]